MQQLIVSPSNIEFTPVDGFKDTTLTINIETIIKNVDSETTLGAILRDKSTQTLISSHELNAIAQTDTLTAQINIETSTSSFENFLVEVYAYDNSGNGNSFQSGLSIIGLSSKPPVVADASNPESVTIPSEGSVTVPFSVNVTDEDGQDNIDRVLIEFINENGSSLIPFPNQLFDNGTGGDLAASDSVYTITFSINATNTPNNRTALYFAVDKAGLHSDTLQTKFNIVEQ